MSSQSAAAVVLIEYQRLGAPIQENWLSDDERRRADRITHLRTRQQFLLGRTMIRRQLASRLACHPRDLCFTTGPFGKPELADAAGIHFNLAHSGNWVVLATTTGCRIGVDLEWTEPARETDDLARRYFSPFEWAEMEPLPEPLRRQAFYRCWTCKEAFVKLIGDGLTFPLDAFDVDPIPGRPAELRAVRGATELPWRLFELPAPSGYVAHLASDGEAQIDVQPHPIELTTGS